MEIGPVAGPDPVLMSLTLLPGTCLCRRERRTHAGRRHRRLADADAGRVEERVRDRRRRSGRRRLARRRAAAGRGRCDDHVVTFGASLKRRIGYVTQSRLVTRVLSNVTASWSARLDAHDRARRPSGSRRRSGLTVRPASCAAVDVLDGDLAGLLVHLDLGDGRRPGVPWRPKPKPRPVTTFAFDRFEAATRGCQFAALRGRVEHAQPPVSGVRRSMFCRRNAIGSIFAA